MPAVKPFIYLFTGEEFLRRGKIESLLTELVPGSLRTTNLWRFYADDLDWSVALPQASTPSLIGGAQVFWISLVDELKKGDFSAFESYCAHPARESYFVFEADELAASHPLVKLVGRFGKHFHLGRKSGEDGLEALRNKLKRFGKVLTLDAWQVLQERLAGSPRLMDMALDQLILYADGATIDEKSVLELASEFLRYEPFDLTEALARKDVSEALKIFHFFYELNGDMTSMVGLLHWQLKRIWQAKKILAHGGNQDEISRTLRIPPFRLTSFLNQVKRFDFQTVERLLEALWKMDWNVKTGACEESVAMEMFLASTGAG